MPTYKVGAVATEPRWHYSYNQNIILLFNCVNINFQFLSHQETERRLFDSLAELGAGPRIALGTSGYEPEMILFHYPAIKDNLFPFTQRLSERVKQNNVNG